MPGFAGRQVGISLKGETLNHKGIFGKQIHRLAAGVKNFFLVALWPRSQ
jgi:hypothetical protein